MMPKTFRWNSVKKWKRWYKGVYTSAMKKYANTQLLCYHWWKNILHKKHTPSCWCSWTRVSACNDPAHWEKSWNLRQSGMGGSAHSYTSPPGCAPLRTGSQICNTELNPLICVGLPTPFAGFSLNQISL